MKSISELVIGRQWDIVNQGSLHQSLIKVVQLVGEAQSCDGVFHLFQRKNKKRNFDGTERSVQNSVYTANGRDSEI